VNGVYLVELRADKGQKILSKKIVEETKLIKDF
jgi:hypothetical protein